MSTIPILEDPSYAGRGGGYVARITGKLLQESAVQGIQGLFIPAPRPENVHYVYAGTDVTSPPLFRVPQEFYVGFYNRIIGIYGLDKEEKYIEKEVTYSGTKYKFEAILVGGLVCSVQLSIKKDTP